MFAYAIWNRRTRELFLARDRFGIKPLYYAQADDGTIFFASEIKALLEAGAVRPSLNLNALPDYLANHAPSGHETLFAGIYRLPAGHTLLWHEGTIQIAQYWDLRPDSLVLSGTDADLVDAVPRTISGSRPAAADGRRAARHVPIRWHRLGGDHRHDEHSGR